ncbi:MAG: bifunctional 2-polyprenyl-6-hydroxyphenol methylase/3-demethylubiquinol 3-O-methyltransferase UbiG [Magnetovibrionaceae bacterium]
MSSASSAKSSSRSTASTVDEADVKRFTDAAEAWWDPEGEFKPLHALNPPRLGFSRDCLVQHFGLDGSKEKPLAGLSVIDVGCGGGLLSEPLARLGAKVTGIDAGAESIEIAKIHAAEQGLDIDYRCVAPEAMADLDETFDVVVSMEVLEHVADVGVFLNALARLSKPEGAMLLSTLNRTLKSLALAKVAAEYLLRWVPPGTHDWRKFLKPSEVARDLRAVGFGVKALEGLSYNPLSGDWMRGDDLEMNYMLFAVKNP